MKKYELTSETKRVFGRTLYRIRAVRDFGDVKAGALGGFVETEDNLCHDGNAWVFGNACVSGDARVYGSNNIFWIGNIGSHSGTTTFFACKDRRIRVSCGRFFGDLDKFAQKVKLTHGDNRHARAYMKAIELAKEMICLDDIPDE